MGEDLFVQVVESGGARFSTVRWGAGSVIHVAMLIFVSSVVKTTLGTGTTEFTAPPSLPGIGSTRRLDQSRSARIKLPPQTAQRQCGNHGVKFHAMLMKSLDMVLVVFGDILWHCSAD